MASSLTKRPSASFANCGRAASRRRSFPQARIARLCSRPSARRSFSMRRWMASSRRASASRGSRRLVFSSKPRGVSGSGRRGRWWSKTRFPAWRRDERADSAASSGSIAGGGRVRRREDAVLAREVRETVAQLARLCTVAIISGRDLANVRALVGVEGLVYAGSHGFDIAGPRGSLASNSKGDDFLPVLEMAERELRDALDGVAGSQVERKKYSIAVHYRNVAE